MMERLNYDTIRSYQSFLTVEDMDQAVRGFLYVHKSSLSEGTKKVLNFIWRHSVKVIGVSFAKYDTIANEVELNRRTVIRAVKTLESLGILKKIPTSRMNGKQGVNLLIIQQFEKVDDLISNNMSLHDDTPNVTPNKAENKQRSLCENKTLKPNNVSLQGDTEDNTPTHNQENSSDVREIDLKELDASYVPDTVHEKFVKVAQPFFKAADIYRLWNRVLIAYNKIESNRFIEDLIDIVIKAFKQSVFMKKMRKIHKSFEAYFYSVIYGMFVVEKRKERRHLYYDFLGDE
ncbi:MAG TPA: helix-turn-helix domain-containing protein [Metabacillus sp.]|nr:helix-turn-helix domain-containing protein [Metabacillus sp.]